MYKIQIRDTNALHNKIKNLKDKEKRYFEELIESCNSGSRHFINFDEDDEEFIAGVEKCDINYCVCFFIDSVLLFEDTLGNTYSVYYTDGIDCIVNDNDEFKTEMNKLNNIRKLYESKIYDIILCKGDI
jgi:hypothetical protein